MTCRDMYKLSTPSAGRSPKSGFWLLSSLLAGASLLSACIPEPAVEVDVPVRVGNAGPEGFETNLGFAVEIETAMVAVADFRFAQASAGETFSFRAHPGHGEGGGITGILDGDFAFDLGKDADLELGLASSVVGDYVSASWTLARMDEAGQLLNGDEEAGYSTILRGTATKNDIVYPFELRTRADLGRALEDAPAAGQVSELEPGHWRFMLEYVVEGSDDTVLDDIDFSQIQAEGEAAVLLSPDATGLAREAALKAQRRLHSHDVYRFVHSSMEI